MFNSTRILTLGLIIAGATCAQAQYQTPTVDGTIGGGEYANTSGAWNVTWNATNIYFGITGSNSGEGAVVYIDKDPQSPPASGTNANGSIVGQGYDSTNFTTLPFRADFVIYFKDGYHEYRSANGSGGYTAQTANSLSYASSGGNTREVAIPWSAITGSGIPSSFTWFGYVTSGGGFVYNQTPSNGTNSGGTIGTSAAYDRAYLVSNTGNGTSTSPFGANVPVTLSGFAIE